MKKINTLHTKLINIKVKPLLSDNDYFTLFQTISTLKHKAFLRLREAQILVDSNKALKEIATTSTAQERHDIVCKISDQEIKAEEKYNQANNLYKDIKKIINILEGINS